MKKRLLLISAVDKGFHPEKGYYNPNPEIKAWQPIQLGIIAAYTPKDWDIEIIDENYETFRFAEADLVAISSYTTSVYHAYQIAQEYQDKKIPVVIGGYHATFFPEEAKKYADVVAVGRAEGLWGNIITDFNNNTLQPFYYCDEKAPVCFKPERSIFKKYDYQIGTVMSSLGCPFQCNFCAGPVIQNYHYFLRDIADTVNEIKELEQDYFIFSDDNFIGSTSAHKDRVLALLNKMAEQKINKKWQCATSINISQYPDVLKAAHKAGCVLMYIGVESYDNEDLLQYNKQSNKNFIKGNYKKSFKAIHRNKIAIFGGFLCGTENDTPDDFKRRADTIIKSSVDSFTFTFLTPLPKTRIFSELNEHKKLLYSSFPEDWIYYNCYCATIQPKHGELAAYHNAYNQSMIKLYSMRVLAMKFIRAMLHLRSMRTTIHVYTILKCIHNNTSASVFLKFISKIFEIKQSRIN